VELPLPREYAIYITLKPLLSRAFEKLDLTKSTMGGIGQTYRLPGLRHSIGHGFLSFRAGAR
jgi:hypothetical protein